jgi:hypothetical protein
MNDCYDLTSLTTFNHQNHSYSNGFEFLEMSQNVIKANAFNLKP